MQKRIYTLWTIILIIILTGCSIKTGENNQPSDNLSIKTQDEFPAITMTGSPTISPTAVNTATVTPTNTPTPTPTRVPMDSFIYGVMYAAFFEGEYSSPYYDYSLRNVVKPMGADWITIAFSCLRDPAPSTEITCGIDNKVTKEEVRHVVNLAHELGIRVLMEVMAPSRETSMGYDGQPFDQWFTGYRTFITDYAAFAEELGVDIFSIGCELGPTQHRDQEWRQVADSVREVFSGPITYSADQNWEDITWWDAVDYIGLHPFDVELSNHYSPSVEEMISNLNPFINSLESISTKFDRKVIITTLMYRSIDGVSLGDKVYYQPNQILEVDLQEHADVYEAIILAFQEKPWCKGLILGSYSANTLYNPPANIFLSMYGKPADNVLRTFYGADPRPTATEFVFLDENSDPVEIIYDDRFKSGWKMWLSDPDNSLMDLDEKEIVMEGYAISLSLPPWGTAKLELPNSIDINDHKWLIFDLYITEEIVRDNFLQNYHPVNLLMDLEGFKGKAAPFSVLFNLHPYVEQGTKPKTWQEVRIPLDAFGPVLIEGPQPIKVISILNRSPNNVHFYIDNINLLGKQP